MIRIPRRYEYVHMDQIYSGWTDGQVDLGLKVLAEISLKVSPKLWSKSSFSAHYNLTADDPASPKLESERYTLFSLGVAYKP